MIDLSSLHPTDDSPAALTAAVLRCGTAGRGALAEIERLKAIRVALLLKGDAPALAANLAELTSAMAGATLIGELLEQLQQRARPAEPSPQQQALQAAAELAAWWAQHSAVVIGGAQLLIAAFTSVAKAAAATAPTTPSSNVAPFPRPVA